MTQKWEGGYSCVAEGHDIVAPPPGVFWHLPLVPKKILNILGNLKKIAITLSFLTLFSYNSETVNASLIKLSGFNCWAITLLLSPFGDL